MTPLRSERMSTETDQVAQVSTTSAEPPAPGADRPRRGRREDEFSGEHHVYEPHRIGLPPLRPYLRTLMQRREFAYELSRTNLRAQHFNTVFGQFWLVINPLLLALIYFVLVDILQHGSRGTDFFAHLMAGLFAFTMVNQAVTQGAKSVTSGGRLILNTAFPRMLLPLSSVLTSALRFLPTTVVYAAVHVATGLPVGWHLLWVPVLFVVLLVFTTGATSLIAAATVYFRDISSFLPYVMRIWLYATPVLYYIEDVPQRFHLITDLNPLAPILGAWGDVLTRGEAPSAGPLAFGVAWSVTVFVVGVLFFISREREFAVRL
jgi:ABC-type polysaccharide/polyol phosphate export permease